MKEGWQSSQRDAERKLGRVAPPTENDRVACASLAFVVAAAVLESH